MRLPVKTRTLSAPMIWAQRRAFRRSSMRLSQRACSAANRFCRASGVQSFKALIPEALGVLDRLREELSRFGDRAGLLPPHLPPVPELALDDAGRLLQDEDLRVIRKETIDEGRVQRVRLDDPVEGERLHEARLVQDFRRMGERDRPGALAGEHQVIIASGSVVHCLFFDLGPGLPRQGRRGR